MKEGDTDSGRGVQRFPTEIFRLSWAIGVANAVVCKFSQLSSALIIEVRSFSASPDFSTGF